MINISQAAYEEEASPPCPVNAPSRILLADDDTLMRQMNTAVLLRTGYQVVAVEDGEKGWEALHDNNFDLLITDNDMPKLTGVELVKKLHAAQIVLPVILATGVPPIEELERHPWLQISVTLLKPFSAEELLDTVANVLNGVGGIHTQIESSEEGY